MNKSNNRLLIGLIAIIVVIGLTIGALALYQANQDSTAPAPASDSQQPAESATSEFGRTEISYEATAGITSLEQLKLEAEDVVVSESEYGELVESIEGHKSGTDGNYWSFYVNGEMAQVGAGAYVQEEGDVIEWKFQKL